MILHESVCAFDLVNMSSDLKIEIFGYHIFDDVFCERGVKETESNILQLYRDECIKDNSVAEACDKTFLDAYYIRDFLFLDVYTEEIDFEKAKSWKCLSDCYDHVTRVCERKDLFGHLNIFDRMFATCTYVVNLCMSVYKDTLIDMVNYGHIIWTMYFDQFSEKFYKEGGWNELKRVSKTYRSLYNFLSYFEIEDLRYLKEASINYYRFKMDVKFQERTIHISKQWVKFHVRHFDEYSIIPWYEDFVDCFEIELLLQDLKLICNYSLEFGTDREEILQENFQGAFCPSDISDLKTFDMYEAIKTIDNECQRTIKGFETWLQGASSTTNVKIAASALVDKDEICERVKIVSFKQGISGYKSSAVLDEHSCIELNNLKDANICSIIKTNPKKSEETSNLDLNLNYTTFDRKNEREETNPKALKRQSGAFEASNFSTRRNHNEEYEGPRKLSPENLPNPADLCSDNQVNKSNDSKESLSPLHSNVSNKTEELCNESVKIAEVSSTNQTSANHCKGNAIQKTPNSSKDSPVRIEITNKSDGKTKTNNRLYKLREEQNDPEMRKFLRMILVLGDRQGIQYVCGTLCNREDARENSLVKLNKGKKKSKTQSRK